eukprot:jgi/Mesvir1/7759/Mv11702-RA.1
MAFASAANMMRAMGNSVARLATGVRGITKTAVTGVREADGLASVGRAAKQGASGARLADDAVAAERAGAGVGLKATQAGESSKLLDVASVGGELLVTGVLSAGGLSLGSKVFASEEGSADKPVDESRKGAGVMLTILIFMICLIMAWFVYRRMSKK